ncbi:MAG: chromosome segregation protein SMC [Pirellulaceae bacterium]|nr:chromosome segregation protein SMC [Planctomycetales bacterium]
MLKALELHGFKSFADKTRFEFPAGITVVVGPNGSGKSNIVDAMKWVLGAQSAKSLRGKEMSDVIFKGSGSGKRKPANTAEVTIIFDNSGGQLEIDAPEVHVTRRVFRSGEGEYLINGEPRRLRDIKDLFRGTGVGIDAYSLIEQGKVDSILQASPKDRRAIFEEAAGISRFKSKKVEAQRRLERVDQNLLRLSDIVEEVDHRLRRVKSQATKAQRYREYTDRLQQLRTQVGRVDWRRLSEQLLEIEQELGGLGEKASNVQADMDTLDGRATDLDVELATTQDCLRERETQVRQNREQIVGREATIANQRHRLHELEQQTTRARQQLVAEGSRVRELLTRQNSAKEELSAAQQSFDEATSVMEAARLEADAFRQRIEQLRVESERKRQMHMTQLRESATLGNLITACQSQLESARRNVLRLQERQKELRVSLAHAEQVVGQLETERAELDESVSHESMRLSQSREQLIRAQRELEMWQEMFTRDERRRVAAAERAKILQELEARAEGLGAGVRQVLRHPKVEGDDHPFRGVRGMLADLIRADVDVAPMIDVALGDRSQHFVVAGNGLLDRLEAGDLELAGRIGLLRLESTPPPREDVEVDLTGQSGVIGLAANFVQADPHYRHLIDWLLGDTWLVETLADAMQFARSVRHPVRFVTRRGELIDRDGRLLIGPVEGTLGLVSRKSELAALQRELSELSDALAQQADRNTAAKESLRGLQAESDQLASEYAELSSRLVAHRTRAEAARDSRDALLRQRECLDQEIHDAQTVAMKSGEELVQHRNALASLQQLLQETERAVLTADDQVAELDLRRQQLHDSVTAAEIQWAKSDQQLDALRRQLERYVHDLDERERLRTETIGELKRAERQQTECERRILDNTTALAELYLHDEAISGTVHAIAARCDELRLERSQLGKSAGRLRQQLTGIQQQLHARELEAERQRHERTALAERLLDDYGIHIEQLEADATAEERQAREEVDSEIGELRRKISNIGAVNMDALAELEDLEERHAVLAEQYADLVEAKNALDRIIGRINADSRRLFTETLEAIRANFQRMFRKVFGGGSADIVLEDGVDILETGIDVIATPPGKQALNMSLLSGGERALTVVTLLLAIFEYRPSPFCVLDEVDGPLDESNVGRFTDVLNEFLKWTKFVVVTHSKKTMTAAHTLYGVTMQESGVSKRVSVRFEDVSEDGRISQSAIEREPDAAGPETDERGAA